MNKCGGNMKAKELKIKLKDRDIKIIMKSLGAIIWSENDEQIIYNTICHSGNSVNKLCYFKRCNYDDYNGENNFYCYTECGSIDILRIVQHVKSLNLYESIQYITTLLGISDIMYGFKNEQIEVIEDWDFINSFERNYNKLENSKNITNPILSKNNLKMFQFIPTSEWIEEGITVEVMKMYNILYSTLNQSIVIPHFDINDNLIGIRQRNLLENSIKYFGKYTPLQMCGIMYSHKLNNNLYGININKETIKRKKKVMLVESEKSVLQSASMFGIENNFTLALCGCTRLSDYQIDLLLELEVEEIIIGLDRQYETVDSKEYWDWLKHIKNKIITPLLPYFKVNVLWDMTNLLGYKDSPTDRGKDVLLKLMKNKIYIN